MFPRARWLNGGAGNGWRGIRREPHVQGACDGRRRTSRVGQSCYWFSRRVLSWRVSITMEAAFCVETLQDALARHGKPDIFNTDQGSQFTGQAFTGVLANKGIAISMDGKGAWRDNVFVERLWRSVKYEEVSAGLR